MTGMTYIVKTITRWVKLFIFLYGVYVTLTGHLSPGGGFAGGVIISCSFILLTLAYGRDYAQSTLKPGTAKNFDSLGALLFLVPALIGIWAGNFFFENFLQKLLPGTDFMFYSSGLIPIYNIAICLKVGAPLFVTFVVLAVIRVRTGEHGAVEMTQDVEEE
jgi:multisubunit Na+/H+ antiporter MnhB subunit